VFLDVLVRRNPAFVGAAIDLHQRGEIPANSYVFDADAVAENARLFAEEARRRELLVLAMTKQVGRNPTFLDAAAAAGLETFVAVDMEDARRIHAAGHRVGHVGHLVQVPRGEARAAAAMSPDYWTVFSADKAWAAATASADLGREQRLLVRLYAEGDVFYTGHEGGFPAEDVVRIADLLDGLEGASFAGVTTFPALLYEPDAREVRTTPNLRTLERAAEALRAAGRSSVEVNAPGTTSIEVLDKLVSAGATQVEPGHGLTGTTPLHAVRDLPERPAVLYLSEISHVHGGRAYCFGGGLYIDPVFPSYQVRALVGSDPNAAVADRIPAEIPPPEAIDYYGMLDIPDGRTVAAGDTVIFGFRIQAFVTRAFVVPVSGVGTDSPSVVGVWLASGERVAWPP
jgi:predicted amino acid racemase